ncbi:Coxsackievirus and adenovirus receptor-like protein, partial [Nibea albiflora]
LAPSQTVWAFAGGVAILPCSYNGNNGDDLPAVEWSKEGLQPHIVLLYRDGCETHGMKNPAFEYRTSLIMEELKNGDISLRISNVQLSDAGTYQCKKLGKNAPKDIPTVQLVVASPAEFTSRRPTRPGLRRFSYQVQQNFDNLSVTNWTRNLTSNVTTFQHLFIFVISVGWMRSCTPSSAITSVVTILLLLAICAPAAIVWMKFRKPVADHKSQPHEKEAMINQPNNSSPQPSPTVDHPDQPTLVSSNSDSSLSISHPNDEEPSGFSAPDDFRRSKRRSLVLPSSVQLHRQRNSSEDSEYLVQTN